MCLKEYMLLLFTGAKILSKDLYKNTFSNNDGELTIEPLLGLTIVIL
jgi:hypothetical protein